MADKNAQTIAYPAPGARPRQRQTAANPSLRT